MQTYPKILFFDSGLGGLSVFKEVFAVNRECVYYYLFDHACFPYGNKSEDFLKDRVVGLLQKAERLLKPDIVVIACNTASTVVLPYIRALTEIPVVGTVPAVKPAAVLSENRVIGLLATPGTVKREYTNTLIQTYAGDCKVISIGSERLVKLAEDVTLKTACGYSLGREQEDALLKELAEILHPFTEGNKNERPDTVVLGCTHFPLLKDKIASVLGKSVRLVDSGSAIAHRVRFLLENRTQFEQAVVEENNGDLHISPGPDMLLYTGSPTEENLKNNALLAGFFGFGKALSFDRMN